MDRVDRLARRDCPVTGRFKAARRLHSRGWEALGLERAVLIAFAGRAWQALAGLGTLYFIVEYFSPVTQGYYQTFLSLLALSTFIELGMLGVIVSVVSHEWAGLSLRGDRRVEGEPEKVNRLAAATRFVGLWFAGAALLFFLFGGGIGAVVLMQHGRPDVWLAPWLAVIALGSLFIWTQGLVSVVEGCNRVLDVAIFRLVQGVLSVLALWVAVTAGAELWSLAAPLATNVACATIFLFVHFRGFFAQMLAKSEPSSFDWRTDIWPMQWPIALQGIVSYFMFSLFVPVIFSYHGPVEAGRMGLSLQVVVAMQMVAAIWLSVQAPRMGTMFAAGDYRGYEGTWRRAAIVSSLFLLTGAVTVCVIAWLAAERGVSGSERFLDPLPFAVLVLWCLALHIVQCCATYWRAQRIELLGFWGVLPGAVTGVGVWLLGQRYGALGAAGAAFAAAALVMVPLCVRFYFQARRRARAMRAEAEESGVATAS